MDTVTATFTDLLAAATALEERALRFACRTENERNAAVGDLVAASRLFTDMRLAARAAFARSEAARLAAKTFA